MVGDNSCHDEMMSGVVIDDISDQNTQKLQNRTMSDLLNSVIKIALKYVMIYCPKPTKRSKITDKTEEEK